MADFQFEKTLADLQTIIAGVDEVGRGCLAGPVVAAAVILPERWREDSAEVPEWVLEINDSKKLTEEKREEIFELILKAQSENLIHFEIAEASVEEIDKINIYHASHLAMKRAVEKLHSRRAVGLALIDGNASPKQLPMRTHCIVKGDFHSLSIAAASIVAKVYRDRMMGEFEKKYPGYGLATHKGYPTPFHKKALIELGITELHRKSFGPVSALIQTHGNISAAP